MTAALALLAVLSLLTWGYILLLRGFFWTSDQMLDEDTDEPREWPSVVALVPARNEAEVIERALYGLLTQDYPGEFHVIVVDDHSQDGTANQALITAQEAGRKDKFTLVSAGQLPAGWSGKVWAQHCGWEQLRRDYPQARYVLLSDADISHWMGNLRQLVSKAETDKRDLVSLMAMLPCETLWERLLIPPFVFFFQKLYPFRWVNNIRKKTAAAAGGCMLVNAEALQAAGGFAAIKDELIDDCALARNIKPVARERGRGIWLGLGEEVESVRPYEELGPIWDMVARSAYTQLGHSSGNLWATLGGLFIAYLVPPLAMLVGLFAGFFLDGSVAGYAALALLGGAGAYGLMILASMATYGLYNEPPWMGAALPLAALFYGAMTVASARRYRKGKGGTWKGRVQAPAGAEDDPKGGLEEGLAGR